MVAGRVGQARASSLELWTRWRLGWGRGRRDKAGIVPGWVLRGGPGLVLPPLRGQCSRAGQLDAPRPPQDKAPAGLAQLEKTALVFLPVAFSPSLLTPSLGARGLPPDLSFFPVH